MKSLFSIRSAVTAAAVASLFLGALPLAQAHSEGDVIFRVGVAGSRASVNSDYNQSGLIDVDGTLHSASLSTKKSMASDSVGIDFFITSPFNHKFSVSSSVPGYGNVNLGKYKQMPIALSAVYFPMEKNADFQPYLGVSAVYSINKFSESDSAQAEDVASYLGVDDDDLDAKNRFGLGLVAGMDYNVTKEFLLNAQVRYMRVGRGDDAIKNRTIYMVGVGYRF